MRGSSTTSIRTWKLTNRKVATADGSRERAPLLTGPFAKVAEIVENPLSRTRDRVALHHAPGYYALHNHLMDFLVTRSKTLRDAMPDGWDARNPLVVRPALSDADADAIIASQAAQTQPPSLTANA